MPTYDPVARDLALLRLRRARPAIAAVAVAVTGLASAAAAAGFRGTTGRRVCSPRGFETRRLNDR